MIEHLIDQNRIENTPDHLRGATYDPEKDVYVCDTCGVAREYKWTHGDRPVKVRALCKCQQAELDREEKELRENDEQLRIERLRDRGLTDLTYRINTFENDEYKDTQVSKLCRAYVARWSEMRDLNSGLLFTGDIGTGKSFYACAIANALIKQGVSAYVISTPTLLGKLSENYGDAQALLDWLKSVELLVIDDLGAERDTPYGMEQLFKVIDLRARANKPLIVTTNLSLQEMQTELDRYRRRIYDRVLKLCNIPVTMTGKSKRTKHAKVNRDKGAKILNNYMRQERLAE